MLGKESKFLSPPKKTANPPKPYIENLSLASQIFCLKNVGFCSSHNWSWLPLRLGSFTIGSVSTSMIMGGTVDG